MEKRKDRVFYYDAIRVVACLSVIIIHFNASFSAWSGGVFTYPNAVFPNFIFNQSVYLGDFGVSLFFILSGAAMFRTYGGREISLGAFYRKRFLSLYPMFWLAWFAAAAVGVLVYGGIGSGGAKALLATFSGMDGYLLSLGYGGLGAFYKVGEWFLGCMILLYLMMPLLLQGMKKHPLLTLGLSVTVSILIHGETSNIFFLRRVPEVVFGMAFDRYFHPQHGKARMFWTGGTLAGIMALSAVGPKLVSAGYGIWSGDLYGDLRPDISAAGTALSGCSKSKADSPGVLDRPVFLSNLPGSPSGMRLYVHAVLSARSVQEDGVFCLSDLSGDYGATGGAVGPDKPGRYGSDKAFCFPTIGAAIGKFSGALDPGTKKPFLGSIALFG